MFCFSFSFIFSFTRFLILSNLFYALTLEANYSSFIPKRLKNLKLGLDGLFLLIDFGFLTDLILLHCYNNYSAD